MNSTISALSGVSGLRPRASSLGAPSAGYPSPPSQPAASPPGHHPLHTTSSPGESQDAAVAELEDNDEAADSTTVDELDYTPNTDLVSAVAAVAKLTEAEASATDDSASRRHSAPAAVLSNTAASDVPPPLPPAYLGESLPKISGARVGDGAAEVST